MDGEEESKFKFQYFFKVNYFVDVWGGDILQREKDMMSWIIYNYDIYVLVERGLPPGTQMDDKE